MELALNRVDSSQENLRQRGFAGAAPILSTNPHSNLLQTHRILRWGQGSHAIFTAPYSLPQLLQTIPTLIPLEPENLKMLQNELTAPKRWFKARILPTLKRLERDPQAIAEIADIISEIRAKTPVACHATTKIAGETAPIQQHFRHAIDRLQTAPQLRSHGDLQLFTRETSKLRRQTNVIDIIHKQDIEADPDREYRWLIEDIFNRPQLDADRQQNLKPRVILGLGFEATTFAAMSEQIDRKRTNGT